jgi:hypothetical protein
MVIDDTHPAGLSAADELLNLQAEGELLGTLISQTQTLGRNPPTPHHRVAAGRLEIKLTRLQSETLSPTGGE